jgi:hypothetical protein
MQRWIVLVLIGVLGAFVSAPSPAIAKAKKDPCRKADEKMAQTGEGDTDGDGLSDCREKLLRTFMNDSDSDDDDLPDGADFAKSCNPLDHDSDDDGIDDGHDASPAVVQEIKALLDAITCPQIVVPTPTVPGSEVPGSISALGTTAVLDRRTEFEDASCAQLAALLAADGSPFVEIKILENALGELRAKEVELERFHFNGDDDDDDDDDDQGEHDDD